MIKSDTGIECNDEPSEVERKYNMFLIYSH